MFVTISVSFERYLSVTYPNNNFKVKKWLIPLPIAFAILYNLPKFFEFIMCDVNKTAYSSASINSFSINTSFSNLTNLLNVMEINRTEGLSFEGPLESNIYNKSDSSLRFHDDIQNLVRTALRQRDMLLKVNKSDFQKSGSENRDIRVDCDKNEYGVTLLRKNRWYIIFYVFWSDFILIEMLPWIIIVALNLLTWKRIRQFQKNRKRFMRTHSPGNVEIKYKSI